MFMKTLRLLGLVALSALQVIRGQQSFDVDRKPTCYQNRCFYNNKTYAVFYKPLSYNDASEICKTTGGQLAAIRDQKTNDFINKMRQQAQFYGYWININYWQIQRENNEMVAFSGWSRDVAKRGKSASGPNRCPYLSMALNLDWSDEDCQTAMLSYICEYQGSNGKPGLACMEGGSCYEVIHVLTKLNIAKQNCISRGGSLASIAKRPTHEFLKSLILERRKWLSFTEENTVSISQQQQVNAFDTWVGVHYVLRQWILADGTRVEYTHWILNQPDWENETCVEVNNDDGRWNNLRCDYERRYICEFPREIKSTSDCRDGKCYLLVDNPLAHYGAGSDCKKRGGILAGIESEETRYFLQNIVNKRKGGPKFWLGITATPGEFQYSDGTPLKFADWDNGQPTNLRSNKNCAIADKITNRWSNTDCSQKYRFICEYEKTMADLNMFPATPPPNSQSPMTTVAAPATEDEFPKTHQHLQLTPSPQMKCVTPEQRLKLCIYQANICLKMFANVCECLQSFTVVCQHIFTDICQEAFQFSQSAVQKPC